MKKLKYLLLATGALAGLAANSYAANDIPLGLYSISGCSKFYNKSNVDVNGKPSDYRFHADDSPYTCIAKSGTEVKFNAEYAIGGAWIRNPQITVIIGNDIVGTFPGKNGYTITASGIYNVKPADTDIRISAGASYFGGGGIVVDSIYIHVIGTSGEGSNFRCAKAGEVVESFNVSSAGRQERWADGTAAGPIDRVGFCGYTSKMKDKHCYSIKGDTGNIITRMQYGLAPYH